MNETEEKREKRVKSSLVGTGALASSVRVSSVNKSNHGWLDAIGNPRVLYFAVWCKHLLVGKMARLRFFPSPNTHVFLNFSNRRPMDVEKVLQHSLVS